MEQQIEKELALGKEAFARSDFGAAKNHFGAVLRLDEKNVEAEQWLDMIEEILVFRHKDYYNP
jgi:Flp pilus assembly protein TadD